MREKLFKWSSVRSRKSFTVTFVPTLMLILGAGGIKIPADALILRFNFRDFRQYEPHTKFRTKPQY